MSTPMQLLILEDRPSDAELMLYELRRAGFDPAWTRVDTEADYLVGLDSMPDLILADYNLPQFDGLRALELLNQRRLDIPFIIVSASIGEDLAVEAMRQGAADYLIKDRLGRLGQAVKAALRGKELRRQAHQAMEDLRASESRFRLLAENARDIIYRYQLSPVRGFEYISPAVTALTGYTPEELYADPDLALKIAFEDDRSRLIETMRGRIEPEELMVIRWVHKDGRLIWMELRNTLIFDDQGVVIAVEGIARDITNRKRREEQLQLQQSALTAAANSIIITNREGAILWVNPAFEATTGYKAEEVIGQNPRLLKSGQHDQLFYQELWQTILRGEIWRGRMLNRRKDGSLYYEETTITPVRDEEGEVTRFIAIKQDVTERVQAEETIRQQNEFLSTVFESMAHPFYVIDAANYEVKIANSAARASRDSECTTCYALMQDRELPCRGRDQQCPLDIIKQTRLPVSMEHVYYDRQGNFCVDEVHGYPIFDSQGNVVQMIEYRLDVTERRLAEDEVRRQNRELTILNQIAMSAAQSLQLDTLLPAVCESVAQFMEYELALIYLADEAGESAQLQAEYGLPDAFADFARHPVLEEGLLAQILQTGSMFYGDFTTDDRIPARVRAEAPPWHAFAMSPIWAHDRILGVLVLASLVRVGVTQGEVELLGRVCRQIAIAIENAQLYQAAQQRAAELSRVNAFLTSLGQVAARIEVETDPVSVIETMGAELRSLGLSCMVALPESDNGALVLQHVFIDSSALKLAEKLAGYKAREFRFPVDRWTLYQEMLSRQRAVFSPDALAQAIAVMPKGLTASVMERAARLAGVGRDTGGILAPLRVEDRFLGVLSIWGRSLKEEDVAAAEPFASQVAVALERARLLQEAQRRAAQQEALNAIIAAAAAAPNLPEFLETTLDHVLGAVNLESGAIWIRPHATYRGIAAEAGNAFLQIARMKGIGVPAPDPVADWQQLGSDDVRQSLASQVKRLGVRASLVVPVLDGDQRIGGLVVVDPKPREWGEEEVALLEAVGQQLGATAQRLRSMEQARLHAESMARLAAVSETLNRFFTTGEVMNAIGEGALALSRADRAALYLRETDESFSCPWQAGLSSSYVGKTMRFIEELPGKQLLQGIEPFLLGNVEILPADARIRRLAEDEGYRAIALWPLVYEEQTIAALGCYFDTPHTWSEVEQEVTQAFTRQSAVVLRNAQLFDAERQRSRELADVARVSAALRKAVNREQMLPVILDQLLALLEADGAAITLCDPETRETVVELGRGVWEVWTGVTLPPGEGVNGYVIESGQPYVSEGNADDPQVTQLDLFQGNLAAACVPLISQERTIGALWVGRKQPFSDLGVRLMAAVADMAANAFQRAKLHEQTRQYAAELEERVAERTRELAEANERLQELDRLKSKFVSDVSHELRTPITNLGLYLDLLKRGKPENYDRYLSVLRHEAGRLGQLVEDILNLSRLEMGPTARPAFEPVDLNAIIEQVITAHTARAAAAGLQLAFRPSPALPLVPGEPNQLAQVVTNLVINAVNYTREGSVTVSTFMGDGRNQVCLEVRDTGIGIAEEDMQHLFERFYRGQQVGQYAIPGTGLGLAIVKEIVDLHQGELEMESRVGEGSTFRVWLPMDQESGGR